MYIYTHTLYTCIQDLPSLFHLKISCLKYSYICIRIKMCIRTYIHIFIYVYIYPHVIHIHIRSAINSTKRG